MYQIKLEINELPDLFHDKMELLGPGKTKELCSALVRMLYFEYSPSDPRKNVDEMPIFGGYGKNKYIRPPLPDSSSEEEDDEDGDDEGGSEEEGDESSPNATIPMNGVESNGSRALSTAESTRSKRSTNSKKSSNSKKSNTSGTSKASNKKKKKKKKSKEEISLNLDGPLPEDGIVRGADGIDHILLPDRMKILCISRGFKLNRRERRENWLSKRATLRTDGILPPTPRMPKLPLRFIDRVYCGTATRAGLYFYVSVYCYKERPNNYVIKFHHSISCTVLSYNIGRKLCGVLAMESRPPSKWSAKIEHQVCHRVMDLFEVRTFYPPPPSTAPLQMALWYNSVPGISQNAYRRTKEVQVSQSSEGERASRNRSTVVDISISLASFKPVSLALPRSPLL